MLLRVAQYYPQTDSATKHGDRMCFSSTVAMAIKYLKPDALKGSNADDDYLKVVLKYGDTTSFAAHIKACQQYGITAKFFRNGTRRNLLDELNKGFPVATGILHRGHVSKPTGGGHWMLLIGDDGERGIFHDPYGEMDNVNGGYVTIGRGGKEVKYTWRNWLRRWEVEGSGTGWYMTFRSNDPTPTTPTYTNTWEGVVAAARAAGAKFPEVVAAQWQLESNFGKTISGKNNYFGIKGKPGTTKVTTEYYDGKTPTTITATFRDFNSLYECVEYLVTKWYKDYKTYRGVNRAATREECATLLQHEGYATDPSYAKKLIRIMEEHD